MVAREGGGMVERGSRAVGWERGRKGAPLKICSVDVFIFLISEYR